MRAKGFLLAVVLVLGVVAAACSDDGDGTGPTGASGPRRIEITALDELVFDPATIEVQAGETGPSS